MVRPRLHYRDVQDQWHQTNSYNIDDLPVVSKVADIAIERALELQRFKGFAGRVAA